MRPEKNFELGIYSFGNTPKLVDAGSSATAQAIRDVLEAVRVADEVGLDFFGFGEHHTRSMPVSSPTSLVNAAAASTRGIRLGTSVTVLATDEPIRVYQQLATAAAIAPGRIELVAGRGSSSVPFPIFDFDQNRYDELFLSKLELFLDINRNERVTWDGPHRRTPLRDLLVVPRPEQPLQVWLGSGGNPGSLRRAVELGLPLFLGILGGSPEHWGQYGEAYRHGWAATHGLREGARIAVGVHGFVGDDGRRAKATYLEHETRMFGIGSTEAGRARQANPLRARDMEPGGMVFAGEPDEIADRILHLHQCLGHSRQVLQMDVGGMPQADVLRSIELLGTKVAPQVAKALADARPGREMAQDGRPAIQGVARDTVA